MKRESAIHMSRTTLAGGALALLAVLATPSTAGAFNPQPDPPARAALEGRVTDSCSSRPLDGVSIALSAGGERGDSVRSSTTNGGGHYLFRGLPSGDYQLEVRGLPAVQRFLVTVAENGGVTHFNISLVAPGPC